MGRLLKSSVPALVTALALAAGGGTARGQSLLTVSPGDANLRAVDPTSAATLSSVTITLPGRTIDGANGLALDPQTGALWGLLRLQGQPGRELVTVNPTTGVATSVGNTGDSFAGLAFGTAGTLYGVTGDGANTPETLFTLSKVNAAPTLFQTLGNGNDGESIAFNPADGLLYHGSGLDVPVFETVNLSTHSVTGIPLSGSVFEEFLAMTQRDSGSLFLSDLAGNLFTITTGGEVTLVGELDHDAKGMVFAAPVPEPTTGLALAAAGAGLWSGVRRLIRTRRG